MRSKAKGAEKGGESSSLHYLRKFALIKPANQNRISLIALTVQFRLARIEPLNQAQLACVVSLLHF